MIHQPSPEIAEAFKHHIEDVAYDVAPQRLYTPSDLFDAFIDDDCHIKTSVFKSPSVCRALYEQSFDTRIFCHVQDTGLLASDAPELLARVMHDYHIRMSMIRLLWEYPERHVIGIMGGHALLRTDPYYRKVVHISRQLARWDYLVLSGGGPGAMEAAHLGVWMAGRTEAEVDEALAILAAEPGSENQAAWLTAALRVIDRFPLTTPHRSLAIPTWFYGHEPPTIFATHIAKYFENSLREDILLSQAYGGLIYMPGSAGTLQEIFQEAASDHYASRGYACPMVLVGKDFWTRDIPVYPFMNDMLERGRYRNLLITLADDEADILAPILSFGQDQTNP